MGKQNDSCPKSVMTCPKGQKRVLKSTFKNPNQRWQRGKRRGSKRRGRRGRKLLAEDESRSPSFWRPRPMPIPSKCPPVYICVPDKQNDYCPKSVKTCPAGMKRVLKSTLKNPNQRWQRGKRRGSKRRGRRGRKLLVEDESSPPSFWRSRPKPRPSKCPPVYICVPDKQNVHCPKSVMKCPKGQKRVLEETAEEKRARRSAGLKASIRAKAGKRSKAQRRRSKGRGRRGRKLLAEEEYTQWKIAPAVMPRPPKKCPPVYICVP